MATTRSQINKLQIRQREINLDLIDTTSVGKSLITSVELGEGFKESHTGADIGTGKVTINLSDVLAAFNGVTTTGIVVKTPNGALTRSISTSSNLTIQNADGINGNPLIDLADSGVVAGNYRSVKVDAKGRVIEGLSSYEHFVANEVLSTSDGITYTLAHTPIINSLMVWQQGNKQTSGQDKDFTIDGNIITFTTPNNLQDTVVAAYFYGTAFVSEAAKFDVRASRVGISPFRFSLPDPYSTNTLMVFRNGQLMVPGVESDYTIDSGQIVFNFEVTQGEAITASYMLA